MGSRGGDERERVAAHAHRVLGVDRARAGGLTGAGIGVAVIDTGVNPVPGLEGRLAAGVNLSGFGEADDTSDAFGHGTFLAGLIAGGDSSPAYDAFEGGVAPGATIVPVRVASPDGSTDVGTVVAAIMWCVAHRSGPGRPDIDVISLSFGMDGPDDWRVSPLAYACERAWQAGIVVVVSAGNDPAQPLATPGHDPMILTVGATDTHGTVSESDDRVTGSNADVLRGLGRVKPDVVAPGHGLVSYRVPDGFLHRELGSEEPHEAYSRADGTSMSTALVAGCAALLLDQDSSRTPDQVKDLLVGTAQPIEGGGIGQGAGQVDVGIASETDVATLGGTRVVLPTERAVLSLAAARAGLEVGRYLVDEHGVPQPYDDQHGATCSARDEVGTIRHEVHVHDVTDDRGWSSPEGWAEVWAHDRDHTHTTFWPDKPWAENPGLTGEDGAFLGGEFDGFSWYGFSWYGFSWYGTNWYGFSWYGFSWY